jgi:hypothetical protein
MTSTLIRRRLATLVLAAAAVSSLPAPAAAQNPDLILSQAERDSILKDYDQIFPIYGRQAIARGFDIPLPVGFNVGFFSMTQDLIISNLGLGFNGPAQPVEIIKFGGASARVDNVNSRVDLWLFPFLNVYVMGGYGYGHTNVRIAEPVPFETTADFTGANIGLGTTLAGGWRGNVLIADFNHQWAFSSLLDAPVPANIFSPRIARAFRVGEKKKGIRGTAWVGAMLQSLKSETNGNINLAEVVGPGSDSLFDNYQTSEWYQSLGPAQKAIADNLVQRLQGGLDTTTVSYTLNKKPADPWNMLVGGTMDFGRHWGIRYEVGFLGRRSYMIMGNSRIGL